MPRTAGAHLYRSAVVTPPDLDLQWATYFDASDQAGISRLYGGIHIPQDDVEGRVIGSQVGLAAWELARTYFDGTAES